MPESKKGYWAYTHDLNDEMVTDLGSTETLRGSMDNAGAELRRLYEMEYLFNFVVRVVDEATQSTVWIAAPMAYIRDRDRL